MFRQHPVLSVATMAYLGVVCWLTLNPSINTDESSWLWWTYVQLEESALGGWVSFSGLEFAVNVLMFLPIGVFFVLLLGRRRWWAAVIFGIVGSCWIELAQYLWLPARTADLRDVFSNGIGIVVGVGIAMVVTSFGSHRAHKAPITAPQATALTVTDA